MRSNSRPGFPNSFTAFRCLAVILFAGWGNAALGENSDEDAEFRQRVAFDAALFHWEALGEENRVAIWEVKEATFEQYLAAHQAREQASRRQRSVRQQRRGSIRNESRRAANELERLNSQSESELAQIYSNPALRNPQPASSLSISTGTVEMIAPNILVHRQRLGLIDARNNYQKALSEANARAAAVAAKYNAARRPFLQRLQAHEFDLNALANQDQRQGFRDRALSRSSQRHERAMLADLRLMEALDDALEQGYAPETGFWPQREWQGEGDFITPPFFVKSRYWLLQWEPTPNRGKFEMRIHRDGEDEPFLRLDSRAKPYTAFAVVDGPGMFRIHITGAKEYRLKISTVEE